jgi:hypothetical protein
MPLWERCQRYRDVALRGKDKKVDTEASRVLDTLPRRLIHHAFHRQQCIHAVSTNIKLKNKLLCIIIILFIFMNTVSSNGRHTKRQISHW